MPSDLAAPVTLSASAAKRVAAIAAKQGKPALLRLSVEGGGCSGFQYQFGLADAPEADDTVAETDGVRLVVDPVSLDLVAGCVVSTRSGFLTIQRPLFIPNSAAPAQLLQIHCLE